jgi:hypothetical protein
MYRTNRNEKCHKKTHENTAYRSDDLVFEKTFSNSVNHTESRVSGANRGFELPLPPQWCVCCVPPPQ